MSQTVRRQKFFKRNKQEYPMFPGWNATLVDDGHGMLVRLVVMTEEEFATMPGEARWARGIPTMVCLHSQQRTIEVYPVPEDDFDIVTETKSWSAA